MVNKELKVSIKILNYMKKFKPKKAKQKIAELQDPWKKKKFGIKVAKKIYANYVDLIVEYKDEYKFNCSKYMQKCCDKINA